MGGERSRIRGSYGYEKYFFAFRLNQGLTDKLGTHRNVKLIVGTSLLVQDSGVYILKNTMARGWNKNGSWGKNMKIS